MLSFFYAIDSTAFRAVNHGTANGAFDVVMPFITEPAPFLYVLIPLLLVLGLWSTRPGATAAGGTNPRGVGPRGAGAAAEAVVGSPRLRVLWCVLLVAVAVTIGDRVNSVLIKNWVGRDRPCAALQEVRLLRPCGGGRSFPSSHAVNIAAFAVIAGAFFRRFRPYGIALAAAICYSRVYVGVHYPADVLGGAALGAGLAWGLLWVWRAAMRKV